MERECATAAPSLRAAIAHAVDLRQHAQHLGLEHRASIQNSAELSIHVDLRGPGRPALRDASVGQWWPGPSSSEAEEVYPTVGRSEEYASVGRVNPHIFADADAGSDVKTAIWKHAL